MYQLVGMGMNGNDGGCIAGTTMNVSIDGNANGNDGGCIAGCINRWEWKWE